MALSHRFVTLSPTDARAVPLASIRRRTFAFYVVVVATNPAGPYHVADLTGSLRAAKFVASIESLTLTAAVVRVTPTELELYITT